MPKAKVSWLLCIGRLVSKTDNVIHFARLVKQAGVDLVSRPICLYGAYMVHHSMRVGTDRALVVGVPLSELILIGLPGWGSYGWWQHSYVSRDLDNLNWGCVTAEVSSLRRLTNDASRHQFLAQMPKAKVSWLLCIGRLVSKTDNVIHFARLVKQAGVDLVSRPICLYGAYISISIDACNGPHKLISVQPTPSVSIIPIRKHWCHWCQRWRWCNANTWCGQDLMPGFSYKFISCHVVMVTSCDVIPPPPRLRNWPPRHTE